MLSFYVNTSFVKKKKCQTLLTIIAAPFGSEVCCIRNSSEHFIGIASGICDILFRDVT